MKPNHATRVRVAVAVSFVLSLLVSYDGPSLTALKTPSGQTTWKCTKEPSAEEVSGNGWGLSRSGRESLSPGINRFIPGEKPDRPARDTACPFLDTS